MKDSGFFLLTKLYMPRCYTLYLGDTMKAIYEIKNKVNGKFYIGSSINVTKRWWEHKKMLDLGIHTNKHLQSSWNKHTEKNFSFCILEQLSDSLTEQEVLEREQEHLNLCVGSPLCYNQNKFASKPDSSLNKKPVIQLSKTTKEQIKEWESACDVEKSLGIAASGIYNACKGILVSAGGFAWVWKDEAERSKYEPKSGKHGGHGKREVCLISTSGEVLKTYSSLAEAAQEHSLEYENIIAVCKGRKMSASGKIFKYKEQADDKNNLTCKICGGGTKTPRGLATHLQFAHKLTSVDYTVKHLLQSDKAPGCGVEGCGESVRYVSFEFKKYCKKHSNIAEAEAGKIGSLKKKENIGQILQASQVSQVVQTEQLVLDDFDMDNSSKIISVFDDLQYSSAKHIIEHSALGKVSTKLLKTMTTEQKKELVQPVLNFYQSRGFPFVKYSAPELKQDWQKLKLFATKPASIPPEYKTTKVISTHNLTGSKIARHFNSAEFYSVSGPKELSMLEAWNTPGTLKEVVENRLGITYKEIFNIHGAMMRQGFRSMKKCATTSTFNTLVAKAVYENYPGNKHSSGEKSIVVDFSMGFGQRMLGACSSEHIEKYIGCDPWQSVFNNNMKMAKFLCVEDKVHAENIGSENFLPAQFEGKASIAFSSPPYFEKEIYDKSNFNQAYVGGYKKFIEGWWKSTVENLSSLLKEDGVIGLNMVEVLGDKQILLDMTNVLNQAGFFEIDRWHLAMGMHNMSKKAGQVQKLEPIVFFGRVLPRTI